MERSALPDEVRPETAATGLEDVAELVRRLRITSPDALNEEAVLAISEVTGKSPELVRLSIAATTPTQKASVRQTVLTMDPKVRQYAIAAWLASMAALLTVIGMMTRDRSSIFPMVTLLLQGAGAYVAITASDSRTAGALGALFGVVNVLGISLFLGIADLIPRLNVPNGPPPPMVIVGGLIGMLVGTLGRAVYRTIVDRSKKQDDAENRHELLRQLVDIQDKLRAHERTVAFLSLDIVGSVRIKEGSSALAVEFTFSEYHRFVEAIVAKNGGEIHSTAGDGVTCTFETSAMAFRAARQVQAGIHEFNAARNRLSAPIQLRAGIHFGTIVPYGPASTDVNFSHVIDLAAHFQKECPPGGVALSQAAAEGLGFELELLGDSLTVDGVPGRVWMPRVRLEPSLPSADGVVTPPAGS